MITRPLSSICRPLQALNDLQASSKTFMAIPRLSVLYKDTKVQAYLSKDEAAVYAPEACNARFMGKVDTLMHLK